MYGGYVIYIHFVVWVSKYFRLHEEKEIQVSEQVYRYRISNLLNTRNVFLRRILEGRYMYLRSILLFSSIFK